MEQQLIEQVTTAIKNMVNGGQSYGAVARKLKISKSSVSSIVNEELDKISSKMWQSLYGTLGFKSSHGYQLAKTSIFEQIQAALLRGSKNRLIAIAVATGNGKTTTARHYCRNTPNAIYLQIDATMSSTDLLSELGALLGTSGRTRREKINNIAAYLVQNKVQLVLDEFSTAKSTIWETVFTLVKMTEDNCSFALVGTPMMRNFIERAASSKGGFSEINRRIAQNWVDIDFSSYRNDVIGICKANKVTNTEQIKAAMSLPNFGQVGDFIKNLQQDENEKEEGGEEWERN